MDEDKKKTVYIHACKRPQEGIDSMPIPMVAIIGRPNVGKSTLFNRLIKKRVAIEDDRSGVTRDRISERLDWNGITINLVDTGGLIPRAKQEMDSQVSAAAEAAIRSADRLVVVVDGKSGPTALDQEVADLVLKSKVPHLLAVTKIDSTEMETDAYQFMRLGLGEPQPVSGMSGLNSGDLLDRIVEGFTPNEIEKEEEDQIRLAIVGRPNVGKSSLVNKLIGEDIQVVTDFPGTTRDPIDFKLRYMNKEIVMVDTAGLKRSREVKKEALEYFTMLRTVRAIERSDVVAFLIDGSVGLTQQDRRLIDETRNKGKGLICVVNKWDLVPKDHRTHDENAKELRHQLPDLSFVPLLFTSALTGQRVRKLLDLVILVDSERRKRITTSQLNKFVERIMNHTPPPSIKGRWLRIKYGSQVSTSPPRFAFFLNEPQLVPESYRRYLERSLREEYGFEGVPLRVVFRKK